MDDTDPDVVSDTIRYQGKAVDDSEWIADFLTDGETGVLGLVDGDEPHLVTQLYVYDDETGAVYLHGAQAGRAYDVVAREGTTPGAFTVSERGRFIPAEQPVNFTVEYASVVANGTVDLIVDASEKRRVLELFMDKFAPHLSPGEDYEPIADGSVDRTAVYRFDVESWSGKRGEKAPDYPGAYDLESVSESQ